MKYIIGLLLIGLWILVLYLIYKHIYLKHIVKKGKKEIRNCLDIIIVAALSIVIIVVGLYILNNCNGRWIKVLRAIHEIRVKNFSFLEYILLMSSCFYAGCVDIDNRFRFKAGLILSFSSLILYFIIVFKYQLYH